MDERPGGDPLGNTPFNEARALAELDEVRQKIARYQAEREGVTAEFERFIQSFKKPEPSRPPVPPSRPSPVTEPPPAPVARPATPPELPSPPAPLPAAEPAPAPVVRRPEPIVHVAPDPLVSQPPRVSAPEPTVPAPARVAAPLPVAPPPVLPPPVGPPPPLQPASARFEPLNLEPFIKEVEPAPAAAAAPHRVPTSPEAFAALEAEDEDEPFAPGVDFDALPPPLDPVQEHPVPVLPPPARSAGARTWLALGSIIAVVAAGGYVWKLRQSSDAASVEQPATAPVAGTEPNTPSPGGGNPPQATSTAPTPEQPPTATGQRTTDSVPRTEIVTTDHAWVRVTADGERVLERELPAGSRIPITAQKTIQIRTGNAGAVRVTIGGVDRGPLGREGDVVNRTFTVPASVR